MEEKVCYVYWLNQERKRLRRKHGRMDSDDYFMEIMFANEEFRKATDTAADVEHFEKCVRAAETCAPDILQHLGDFPAYGNAAVRPPPLPKIPNLRDAAARNDAANAEARGTKRSLP